MNKDPICGIDVASTSVQLAVLESDGSIRTEANLPATRAGEQTLLELVPPGSRVVMESTGRYHQRWARCLSQNGREVYVLNALLAKRMAGGHNALRGHKTDRIDARELAQIARTRPEVLPRYRFREDHAHLRLRTLCQVRKGQRAALTNALRCADHLLGVILPEATMLRLSQNQSLADLFLKIDSLARLRGMRRATLERYVCIQTEAFITLLKEPLSAAHLFDDLLPALQAQLRLVKSLCAHLSGLDGEVRVALRKLPRREDEVLVRTIPGFGAKTVPVMLAFLPVPWRQWAGSKRKIARKLQAHFGCDPRLRESGKWKGKVRMTKRGAELARTALFQAAVCGMLYDEHLRAVYDRKKAEGKHHLVAVSHVMRLQLQRMVAVLYDQKPFASQPINLPSLA